MYSEKAIENFYNWEIKGRGYLLYPYPVRIEPCFKPFYHTFLTTSYIDDGKSRTIFERLFKPKLSVIEEKQEEETPPRPYEYQPDLKQISINFSRDFDFEHSQTSEFLNMLSESTHPVSFEIVGYNQKIEIQIISSHEDHVRICHLLETYFQGLIVKTKDISTLPFVQEKNIGIVDFGYDEEFIRPIKYLGDGLRSVLTIIDNLKANEASMLQVIFKGAECPWSRSIINSVMLGNESFFPESPEMISCVKEKTSSPLFSVILRLAVQSYNDSETIKLTNEIIRDIKTSSRSEYNSLIPLSNHGYDYKMHFENLSRRKSNRHGMIMNSQELSSYFRFYYSHKIISSDIKTKAAPESVINNKYLIGVNSHLGISKEVTLSDEQRLRHCHIIGATGSGKSMLISNLLLEDIKHGNGCAIFDPHGDTIEDIIPHIPHNRLQDVILFDPSDNEFVTGINLLRANSEVEKIVLSSDLVEAFRRHSTSWGDQMTSVLSNAINTFLYSNTGGTLVDLKRFLLEDSFRKEFLKSVDDSSIKYYWNNEFPLLRKLSISPLITRLDTFLRPKVVRNILSQKEGLDFTEIINQKKILLVKLAQGLIGEENSYLLGTLILSKLYQVTQARQLLSKEDRHPFYIYIDEFQNFITPSINSILAGARKYGVGLVLAHQELDQIKDTNVSNSVLSNTNIRFCFRMGDFDAKKLESGFSSFSSADLQNLNVGDAIVRVGKHTDDFSLWTYMLKKDENSQNVSSIIQITREKYSKRISEIKEKLNDVLSIKREEGESQASQLNQENIRQTAEQDLFERGNQYLENLKEKDKIREHRYLQTLIKKIAEQRGFKATIEEIVDGGRVDVSLTYNQLKIAIEIALSNSVDYELNNIIKCLNTGYSDVCVVTKDQGHLENIKEKAMDKIDNLENVHFLSTTTLITFLDSIAAKVVPNETKIDRVKGYRIKVNYRTI